MKDSTIKARIKRNKLDKLAEIHYRDESSSIIQHLNSVSKQALVGIQREDGVYTALGYENAYYSTSSGVESKIAIGDFLTILQKNAMLHGKTKTYECIKINESDFVWVMNIYVMNALWNTMLLVYKD